MLGLLRLPWSRRHSDRSAGRPVRAVRGAGVSNTSSRHLAELFADHACQLRAAADRASEESKSLHEMARQYERLHDVYARAADAEEAGPPDNVVDLAARRRLVLRIVPQDEE